MKGLSDVLVVFIPHPSPPDPAFLVRLRTYPQHTCDWLPLLRSRPGGVHRRDIVRSPKSDKTLKHCRLSIANCQLPVSFVSLLRLLHCQSSTYKAPSTNRQSAIENRQCIK